MRPSLVLLVVLLLAPFAAPGASAQPAGPQPLDRLLPEIRRNHPGQFLDAEGITRNGSPGYRLKWLTPEGRVVERDVDARTGRVMGEGPERPGGASRGEDGGFSRREDAQRPQTPRGNFRPTRPDNSGEDAQPRFGNRGFGPRPDFNPDRFNRPSAGEYGGRRFGGGDDGARRGFGNGRRSRGRED